jgi:CBS domain-containing protein
MWQNDCGVLPVVSEAGKVIGIITDRDIAIAVSTKGRLASDIRVDEVISGKVHATTLNDDLKSALETMRRAKVRRLPVLNQDGILEGILSMNDIVLRAEDIRGTRVPEISFQDVARTYQAICEHRSQLVARA